MEELRCYWETPGIVHFCYLFRDGLKLPKFEYQDFELALLSPLPIDPKPTAAIELVDVIDPNQPEQSNPQLNQSEQLNQFDNLSNGYAEPQEEHLVLRIVLILLRGYFKHTITKSNWEQYLHKLFDLLWVGREGLKSPFHQQAYDDNGKLITKTLSFNELTLKKKVEVLYHLCEYRLYQEDASTLVAHLVEDELRPDPIGKDSKGNLYWYFFGSRLYRECPDEVKQVELTLERLEKQQLKKPLPKPKKEPDTPKEPPKKKQRPHIPGERSSQRERKPVIQLQIAPTRSSNNRTSSNGSSKNNSSKSSKSKTQENGHVKEEETIEADPSTSCGVPLDDLKKAWCCICDTRDSWVELVEALKKSKNSLDKQLCDTLSTNFLPNIEEVFAKEEKQRALEERKKLFELIPRRTSSRQQIKKLELEEKERKEQEEKETQRRMAVLAEERRKREEDWRKKQEAKLAREQRSNNRLELIEKRSTRTRNRMNGDAGDVGGDSSDDSDCDDRGEIFIADGSQSNWLIYDIPDPLRIRLVRIR